MFLLATLGMLFALQTSSTHADVGDPALQATEYEVLLRAVKDDDPISKHAVFKFVMISDAPSADQIETAIKLLGESASDGYAVAQFNLGILYRYGKWVPRDRELALRWLLSASTNGLLEAKIESAGLMYELALTGEAGRLPSEYLAKSVAALQGLLAEDELDSEQRLKALTYAGRSLTYLDPYQKDGWALLAEAACSDYSYARELIESGIDSFVKAQVVGDNTASTVIALIELNISEHCTEEQVAEFDF